MPMSWTDRLKYLSKCTVARALYTLGLLHLWKHFALRGRAVVLTYHRVLSGQEMRESWSHPAIVVSPDVFERHMRVLARSFHVLGLSEFQSHLNTGTPFKTASCLVTFDDGWKDTYTAAWPVLRRWGLPATVFLPVKYIGSEDVFWQERLGQLLFDAWRHARSAPDARTRLMSALAGTGLETVLDAEANAVRRVIVELVRAKKIESGWVPSLALDRLAAILDDGGRSTTDRFMTWEEVKEMSTDGVTFGAHGETHRVLTGLTEVELEREMTVPRRTLEAVLGKEVSAVSYPNGNWNSTVTAAAERAGFTVGFSMMRGRVALEDHRLAVRRVNIFDDVTGSEPMFLARVLGLF